MKTILLISNKVLHYRIRIYNAFFDRFKALGYEFHVAADEYQEVGFEIRFVKHQAPFRFSSYRKLIDELRPDAVINFLHLRDGLILPLTFYCRLKGIPMIYWNHGINIKTPDARWKNMIFRFIHSISNALILYTPDQLKYLTEKSRRKTFIAYNTLDFSEVHTEKLRSPEEVKKLYRIKEKKVVLYISRILPYKRLDLLLDAFRQEPEIGLVIVGSGINDRQKAVVEATPNYYYLGEKYGNEVDEIYRMGDVFSTPGHIGLALNQACFWGKPVVVLKGIHAPEIYYMKNGYNGYVADTPEECKARIMELCRDDERLEKFSRNARRIYEEQMGLENMFGGFKDAITFVKR